MIYLDQAILNRYVATGLLTSIGQIYDEQQPEHSVLPYVSYENMSDNRAFGSQSGNVYQKATVTFTVWSKSKDDPTTGVTVLAELIQNAFQNSNKAASNPLTMTSTGGIVYCRLDVPYIAKQISDTIWSAAQTFSILYRRSGNPVPA